MSPLELVDDRFGDLARELRAARPVASPQLRERVHALAPQPRSASRSTSGCSFRPWGSARSP